jgi:Rod binding domain-containing protein
MTTTLPVQATPDATELARPGAARAWKAAQDFEAMTLGRLLAPMLETVDTSKGPFGGGSGEEEWKPFLTEAIGKRMAAHGGIGLAVPIYRQMLRLQENLDAAAATEKSGDPA